MVLAFFSFVLIVLIVIIVISSASNPLASTAVVNKWPVVLKSPDLDLFGLLIGFPLCELPFGQSLLAARC